LFIIYDIITWVVNYTIIMIEEKLKLLLV